MQQLILVNGILGIYREGILVIEGLMNGMGFRGE